MNKSEAKRMKRELAACGDLAFPPIMASHIIICMIESAIIDGQIKAKGKSADEIYEAFHRLGLKRLKEKIPYAAVVDKMPYYWERAEGFEKKRKYALAASDYSTWAAHQMNFILRSLCNRRDTDEVIAASLLSTRGLKTKFLLIHLILRRKVPIGLMNDLHKLSGLKTATENPNWRPMIDSGQEEELREKLIVEAGKGVLAYLKQIEENDLLAGASEMLEALRQKLEERYRECPVTSKQWKPIQEAINRCFA